MGTQWEPSGSKSARKGVGGGKARCGSGSRGIVLYWRRKAYCTGLVGRVAWRAFGNALCGSVVGSSAVFVVGLSGEVHGTRRWRW